MSTSPGTPIPESERPYAPPTGTTSPSGRSRARAEAPSSAGRRDLILIGAALAALLALILGILLAGCGSASSTAVHRASIATVKVAPWNEALSRHAQNALVSDPTLGFAV